MGQFVPVIGPINLGTSALRINADERINRTNKMGVIYTIPGFGEHLRYWDDNFGPQSVQQTVGRQIITSQSISAG